MTGYPLPLPLRDPIVVKQGESLDPFVIALTNPDGSPCNLVGWTSHATLRSLPSDTSAVLDLTDANGGIVIDADAGTLGLHGNGAVTAALTPRVYSFDWFAVDALGQSRCLRDSTLTLLASDTHYP